MGPQLGRPHSRSSPSFRWRAAYPVASSAWAPAFAGVARVPARLRSGAILRRRVLSFGLWIARHGWECRRRAFCAVSPRNSSVGRRGIRHKTSFPRNRESTSSIAARCTSLPFMGPHLRRPRSRSSPSFRWRAGYPTASSAWAPAFAGVARESPPCRFPRSVA